MIHAMRLVSLVLAVLGVTVGAQAVACSRQQVASLALDTGRASPSVEVRMNGTALRLFLDTGAAQTIVSVGLVRRLGLPTDWGGFSPLWGIGGVSVHFDARLADLEFGGIHLRDRAIAVGDFGATWSGDGLLGADILSRYDVDIDLAGKRVALYRAIRCNAPAPGWKQPFAALALLGTALDARHAKVQVLLDGHPLVATIDTGAQRSTLTRRAASRLGLTSAALDADRSLRMVGVGRATSLFRRHRFGALRLGGVAWRAPDLLVGTLPPLIGDMLLGTDFLRAHRIWISWVNQTVFLAQPAGRAQMKQ